MCVMQRQIAGLPITFVGRSGPATSRRRPWLRPKEESPHPSKSRARGAVSYMVQSQRMVVHEALHHVEGAKADQHGADQQSGGPPQVRTVCAATGWQGLRQRRRRWQAQTEQDAGSVGEGRLAAWSHREVEPDVRRRSDGNAGQATTCTVSLVPSDCTSYVLYSLPCWLPEWQSRVPTRASPTTQACHVPEPAGIALLLLVGRKCAFSITQPNGISQ